MKGTQAEVPSHATQALQLAQTFGPGTEMGAVVKWDPENTALLIQCLVGMRAKSFQSCLTLCDPMDRSLAPLSMGFSRQKYWSGLPCPPPRDLPRDRT